MASRILEPIQRLKPDIGKVLNKLDVAAAVLKTNRENAFFRGGFGDLSLFDRAHRARPLLIPGAEIDIAWGPARTIGTARLAQGAFPSPVCDLDLPMPDGTTTATVELVLPRQAPHPADGVDAVSSASGGSEAPAVPIHVCLGVTGDEGFVFRRTYALQLAHLGIGTLSLEYPFYGTRRPEGQVRHYLNHVSDFAPMGRATIEECKSLLRYLNERGYGPLGMSGLSQGGIYAAFVGMLTPDVATALITFASPDNAAPVFTQGILTREVCWEALRGEVPEGTDEAAAQEISRLLTTYANVASVHAFALEEDPSYVSPYDDPATSPPVVHVYSSDDMYIPDAKALAKKFPHSTVVRVVGGHLSSVVFNRFTFVRAVVNALKPSEADASAAASDQGDDDQSPPA